MGRGRGSRGRTTHLSSLSLIFNTSAGPRRTYGGLPADAAAARCARRGRVRSTRRCSRARSQTAAYGTDAHHARRRAAGEYFVFGRRLRTAPETAPMERLDPLWDVRRAGGIRPRESRPPGTGGAASRSSSPAVARRIESAGERATGGGANCNVSATTRRGNCPPGLKADGALPERTAQPFNKSLRVRCGHLTLCEGRYVSHVVSSHVVLALSRAVLAGRKLTERRRQLERPGRLFDRQLPSLGAKLTTAPLQQQPPAQMPGDPGCRSDNRASLRRSGRLARLDDGGVVQRVELIVLEGKLNRKGIAIEPDGPARPNVVSRASSDMLGAPGRDGGARQRSGGRGGGAFRGIG